MRLVRGTVIALSLAAPPGGGIAADTHRAVPPARVGSCAFTTVREVTQRLANPATHRSVANTGSTVVLANGVLGVSYDQVPAVNASRRGDRALTCLVKVPQHCPPGDRRGRLYTTTNLRTDESWTVPDSEHQCGGA